MEGREGGRKGGSHGIDWRHLTDKEMGRDLEIDHETVREVSEVEGAVRFAGR
jgi:hypothetical protein